MRAQKPTLSKFPPPNLHKFSNPDTSSSVTKNPSLPPLLKPFRSAFKLTLKVAPILVAGWVSGKVRNNNRMNVSRFVQKGVQKAAAVRLPSISSAKTIVDSIPSSLQEIPDELLDTVTLSKMKTKDYDETWLDKFISAVLMRLSDVFSSSGY
ncbi:hypothetical protein TL16_g08400 [Triparma laevis f. inornata]|uniref:Uncharacterized protein n=1 Tax=Triparma laevis f. inornata TaxID=1714386 RepID=A0A9W7EJE0_9STRA|nr:hypothetical protein TL16_g08400 [Triparma laevis f. inornata]